METNRPRRDMGRYPQGKNGSGGPGENGRPVERGLRENCGCGNSTENMDAYVVAMAYVPWQKFGEVYDLKEGFRIGTIFPELNRPFLRGGCRNS